MTRSLELIRARAAANFSKNREKSLSLKQRRVGTVVFSTGRMHTLNDSYVPEGGFIGHGTYSLRHHGPIGSKWGVAYTVEQVDRRYSGKRVRKERQPDGSWAVVAFVTADHKWKQVADARPAEPAAGIGRFLKKAFKKTNP